MKKLFLLSFLIILISNTAFADNALDKLKSYVDNKLKGQIIELVEFQKTKGEVTEIVGMVFYTFSFDITIKFNANGWLKGNDLEGYWRNNLYVYPSKPNLAKYGQQYMYATRMYPRGSLIKLGCMATMVDSGNGFRVEEFSIKTERKLGVTQIQSNSSNNLEVAKSQSKPVRTYKIGEKFGGGIIFYVDKSGQHGLIASLKDQTSLANWHNGHDIKLGATSSNNGKYNSNKIINALGTRGYHGAKFCKEYRGGGFSDWYLPSIDELSLMYKHRNLIGSFYGDYYWSSTEISNIRAWEKCFDNGASYEVQKRHRASVRAVRAF